MKFTAVGRVHPERADIFFSKITWQSESSGSVSIACESSQLCVSLDDSRIDGYVTAFVTAEHIAQTVVSSLGYSLGCGYSAEIIQVIEDSGESHCFGVMAENLRFEDHNPVFSSALGLARQNLYFRFALQDYTRALTEHTDCAFFCYRVIEAIKSSFAARSQGGGWAEMHTALGTNEETITSTIKAFADPVRHGNWFALPQTTAQQRNDMLSLTRSVLETYRHFADRSA